MDSLTIDEVAAELQIHNRDVYALIDSGQLAAYRSGNRLMVQRDDLEAYQRRS